MLLSAIYEKLQWMENGIKMDRKVHTDILFSILNSMTSLPIYSGNSYVFKAYRFYVLLKAA